MFKVENPQYYYAFFIVAILIAIYIFYLYQRRKKLKRLGDNHLIEQLIPEYSPQRRGLKFRLMIIALILIILAMLNPQTGSKLETVKRKGIDIMIVLDISNSMLAEDISPNRLSRAKYSIGKFLDRLQNDRIGLVVFAGRAYMQLPITPDIAAAKMFLETVNTKIIPTQGTAVGAALKLAIGGFPKNSNKNKVILLFSDGENHEDNALEIAKIAADENIVIHTIGYGSPAGVPIPVYNESNEVSAYIQDKDGNIIVSKLNEDMLEKIANFSGGKYIRAASADPGLRQISNEIEKMQKTEFESRIFSEYDHNFYYFSAIALFFMLMELLISERKAKWLGNINLFHRKEENDDE